MNPIIHLEDIRKSYLYNGMRLSEATDGNDARNFLSSGTTTNGGAGGVGAAWSGAGHDEPV